MAGRGRPRMTPGTHGEITVSNVGPSRYKARAYYRASDGQRYTMSRRGQTKDAARRALTAALADWQRTGGAPPLPDATVADMAARWLDTIGRSERSARTKEHYAYAVARYVTPRLGGLLLREVTTRTIDEALQVIRRESGPGAAKTARAVLNGMFGLAVRHGAAALNPVRETASVSTRRRRPRALTVAETAELTDALRSDERALMLDLPDLVDWMLATGCRIGEALAAREGHYNADGKLTLDLDAGTWEVNATLIRVKGHGLQIQERPKTAAGWRVLALPSYAIQMVRRRSNELRLGRPHGVLFGSPHAWSLRDPSNTAADLREVLDRFGFPAITSHNFRKTVATRLEESGQTPRQVADQLGQGDPSVTLDFYFGRDVVNVDAATVLDR